MSFGEDMFQNNMFENLDMPTGDNDQEPNDNPNNRRRRHTQEQIHEMEAFYRENAHPNNMQRQELGRRLSLEPLQIKFWFQNRRTQTKAQHERSENSQLRNLNEKLRAEHERLKEAVANATCVNCGGPAAIGEMSCEHQLIIENACLEKQIVRLSEMTYNCFGFTYPDVAPHLQSHSLDLPVANFNQQGMVGEMLGASDLPWSLVGPTEIEKPIIVELAIAAMDELVKMAKAGEPLWVPTSDNPSHETLSEDEYMRSFLRGIGPNPTRLKSEASRVTKVLMAHPMTVVEILMDVNQWSNVFCGIVSRATTLDVLSTGVDGTYNGAMQVMTAEYQIPSPLIPTRETYFVRYCKQQDDGTWVVVDVSLDNPQSSVSRYRRRPSGCLIQGHNNGRSKVTWVEHAEVDDGTVNDIYKVLVNSGLAFGAKRWVATFERKCERLASAMASDHVPVEDVGGMTTLEGRKGIMKLAERMVWSFCCGIGASTTNKWTTLNGSGPDDLLVMTRMSMDDPGKPPGIVLSAATSFRLQVPPTQVFEILRSEHFRSKWDVLSSRGVVQEMVHIANGRDPGNCVSLLQVKREKSSQSDTLILQESSNDSTGSYVIYAPVDMASMNVVLSGGDPDCVALLPSGFAILPDGHAQYDQAGVLEVESGGSLITIAFQILVDSVPTAKISLGSEATLYALIKSTAEKIRSIWAI